MVNINNNTMYYTSIMIETYFLYDYKCRAQFTTLTSENKLQAVEVLDIYSY